MKLSLFTISLALSTIAPSFAATRKLSSSTSGKGGKGGKGGKKSGKKCKSSKFEDSLGGIVASTPDLSTLLQALEVAGLANAVSCELEDITVFAPTNMAFGNLGDLGATLLTEPGWILHLQNTLLKHVAEGIVESGTIEDGDVVTPLSDEPITANVTDKVCFDPGNACVVIPDVMASNGIAHVVDEVILPNWATTSIANVVVASDPEFSTLLELLTCTGITSFDGGVTVFAPTNMAFQNFFDATGLDAATLCMEANKPTLVEVLTYHVVGSVVPSVALDTVTSAMTLQGSSVNIVNCPESLTINDANIVNTDILTNEGIIHVIDAVLDPSAAPEPISYSKSSKSSSICH